MCYKSRCFTVDFMESTTRFYSFKMKLVLLHFTWKMLLPDWEITHDLHLFLSYRHLSKHTHIRMHTVADNSQTIGLLQGLWRRAPSMGQKTRPRISSWLWRNAWKYERRTAQRCLRWSRRCFMSQKKTSIVTWRQPSKLCWTGPPSGLQKSASQVSFI